MGIFHSLVNPKKAIPKEISRIHNIFDSDVVGAPYFEEVVDKLLYFFGNSVLCAYNIGFDLGFINYELKKINYPVVDLPSIDILSIARKTFVGLEKYSLISVANHLNVDAKRLHRALDDAQTAKEIFLRAKDILRRKNITAIEDFITLYGFTNDFFKKSQAPKMELINRSIFAKTLLKVNYLSFTGNVRTLVIIPTELSVGGKQTYLLGINPKTKDTVKFNLTNILKVEKATGYVKLTDMSV